MTYKFLILSTDPTILQWRTLNNKIKAIRNSLNKTKNGVWEVEVRYRPLAPKVVNNRIDRTWYDSISYPLFRDGYQFVYLHFSMAQWELWNLDRGIRGANHKDSDFVGESYGRGDEHTKRGRTQENQFIQNVLHEMSHELHRTTGVEDKTHAWHDVNPDISGIFASIDMSKWQPVYQEGMKKVGLLTRIIELTKQLNILKKKTRIIHPVPKQFRRVTQTYGNPNSIYKLTKHHIGIDYGTPVGTPIYAPADGEIIIAGKTDVLGYFLHYKFVWNGTTYIMRCSHLDELPKMDTYKCDQEIGYTGNTGMSTGPHLHLDMSINQVNLTGINEKNWRERFIDPDSVLPKE